MELKVGMYIRTRDENISKIKYINKFIYTDKQRYGKHYIEKASENIIDLIEVGDYVNGLRINSITEVDKNNDVRLVWHLNTYGDDDISFSNEEIKSIVTKEQFESMKYVVEE